MFIKEIKKRNSRYGREFIYHRLMESYRTQRGPRQRTLLNLGKLDLAKERWKELADCIEAKVTGQQYLFEVDRYIEQLATHYASLLIHRRLTVMPGEKRGKEKPEYETVDIKSLAHSQSRTIGVEYVGLSMYRRLGLEQFFQRLGFSKTESDLVALSIVGKLVHPGSERRTRKWAQHLSGLDELLGTDFSQLSNNALYRILDLQLSHKEEIEHHLKMREHHLFSLKENIILYDLKHIDSAEHARMTGLGNELILENLKRISEKGHSIWVRIPVIPDYNDSSKFHMQVADFLKSLPNPVERVDLLPFHNWCQDKYSWLGKEWVLSEEESTEPSFLNPILDIYLENGINATIGGSGFEDMGEEE